MGFLPIFRLPRFPGRFWIASSHKLLAMTSLRAQRSNPDFFPAQLLPSRRTRPRSLRLPQAFERFGHSEHADVVETAADDLHADRKARRVVATIDRQGRIFRHVPGNGIADMFERPS